MSYWTEKLKAGDEVIVNYRDNFTLKTVDYITPVGNIKVNGMIFNKDGTQRTSEIWASCRILEATPELKNQIHETRLIAYTKQELKKILKMDLTVEQSRVLLKALTSIKNEDNKNEN